MHLDTDSPVLALDTGQIVRLEDAAGTRILARTGTVWVTFENSPADLILDAGEALVVTRNGRTVVQALQPAWVALQ